MKLKLKGSIIVLLLSGLLINNALSQIITFDTSDSFTNNIVQTNGTGLAWNAGCYITPSGLTSALYSVGTPPPDAYQNAYFYDQAISIDYSTSLTGPSMGIYARVDPTTNIGIAGYVSITDNTHFQFRLYNSANPMTGAVASQVGASVNFTLTGTPITTTDVLTFTLEWNPLDAQNLTMTLTRGSEVLGSLNRSLASAITNDGAVGFRTNGSNIKIYELSIVPEPSMLSMALCGAAVIGLIESRRKRLGEDKRGA